MDRSAEAGPNRPGFWSGAAVGLLTGIGSLLTFQYLAEILRHPSLISRAFAASGQEFETHEALALFIAAENLRASIHTRVLENGLSKRILHAGYRNFRESWARDFSFAAYGLLALGYYGTVKDTLEAFLWNQTELGQFPVKLRSMSVVTRFLHSLFEREQPTEGVLRPKYLSGHGAPSLDGQALLVIAALSYGQQVEDKVFLQKYWGKLALAMKWLGDRRSGLADPLLHQGAFADWADSVVRRGRVLYTNVVYWKALVDMARSASFLDLRDEASRYTAEAENLASAIQSGFWRRDLGYFATGDGLDQLSSDGNLLAIAWGLAQPEQAEGILNVMEREGMAKPVPTRAAHPSYPLGQIALENRLGRVANYHTDASWLWLGAWHVIALVRAGHPDNARELVARIAEVIVRDRQVNEVHAPGGEPLSSAWYKPESPLAWNAGMVIYACHVFENEKPQPNVLSLVAQNVR